MGEVLYWFFFQWIASDLEKGLSVCIDFNFGIRTYDSEMVQGRNSHISALEDPQDMMCAVFSEDWE